MGGKRRCFQRPIGNIRYRKLFVIATEGSKTEPEYFSALNSRIAAIRVKCLKNKHDSSPDKVLRKIRDYIQQENLKASDEAWVVVDRDQWPSALLDQLFAWSQEKKNYGLGLSNPNFEYWLLLHFEEGKGVSSSNECKERLQRYLAGYNKGISPGKITPDTIHEAIRRAKQRDNHKAWPDNNGTTVYRLVQNIIGS